MPFTLIVYSKSSFIINVIILNAKKVIYIKGQHGKEIHVTLVKYNVYQQLMNTKQISV